METLRGWEVGEANWQELRAGYLYQQMLDYIKQDDMYNNFHTNFYGDGKETWLYFIEEPASKNIKIGIATNPKSRLELFQTGCPTPLSLLWGIKVKNRSIEHKIHKNLESSRVRGEWFAPTMEVYEFINAVVRYCADGTEYNHLIQYFKEE